MNQTSQGLVKQFLSGVGFVFRGLKLISSSKKLMLLSLVPFLIDLSLLWFGFSWGGGEISYWVHKALGLLFSKAEGFWFHLAYYPILIMAWFVFVVLLIYVVYFLASVLASPFNGLLAEETLRRGGWLKEEKASLRSWISLSLRMMVVSFVKAIVFLLVGLGLFVLSFVPILNLISAFSAFLILAFDCMDYSWEVKNLGLKDRFAYFRRSLPQFTGMASFLGLTIFIPGLTLLILPAAVVGAASSYKGNVNKIKEIE